MEVSKNQLQRHVADIADEGRRYAIHCLEVSEAGVVSTDGKRVLMVEHDGQVERSQPAPEGMNRAQAPALLPAALADKIAKAMGVAQSAGNAKLKAVVGYDSRNRPMVGFVSGQHEMTVAGPQVEAPLPWRTVMCSSYGAFQTTVELGLLIDLLGKIAGSNAEGSAGLVTIRLVGEPAGTAPAGGKPTTSNSFRLHLAAEGAQGVLLPVDHAINGSEAWADKLAGGRPTHAVQDVAPGSLVALEIAGQVDRLVVQALDGDGPIRSAVRLSNGKTVRLPGDTLVVPLFIGGESNG